MAKSSPDRKILLGEVRGATDRRADRLLQRRLGRRAARPPRPGSAVFPAMTATAGIVLASATGLLEEMTERGAGPITLTANKKSTA